MEPIVEKNDVDISKLFNWGRVFELTNSQGETEALVYMKLLGDADANRARIYALRQSAELRRQLLDEKSDERLIFLKTKEELTEEELKNLIVVYSMREITSNTYRNIKVKKPVQPKSNASLAKMEKYQKEVDDFPALFRQAADKQMQKEVEKLKAILTYEDKDALYKKYTSVAIEEICERRALEAYRNMELYLGCFKDDEYKERFFPSFEVFDNLDTKIKTEFRAAFDKLDVSGTELKKLREATR